MRSRVFVAFGVLLLVCGGVVLAGSTFGFSTAAADRGVSVDTAQEGAYVGLEPIDESINGRQDTATVARITNNLDTSMSLQTTVSQGSGLAVQSDFESSIAAGDSTALTLACAGGGASGTQAVSVTVDQAVADGVTIEGATTTVEVGYQCTGSSKGQLRVQSVSQWGTSTVAFEIENTGSKAAKIKSASIDATTSAATQVSSGNSPEVSIDGAEVVNARGNQEMTIDGTQFGGGRPVTIPAGSTATVTIGQFQTGTGKAVDMEGETVEFTLYGTGQSSYSLSGASPISVSDGGPIDTAGSVTVEYSGEVDGDINAGGEVTTRSASEIDGSVDAGGDVTAGYNTEIDGDIQSGGTVILRSASEISGGVDAAGDVTAGSNSEVGGDIQSGGDVTIRSSTQVDGDIDAQGDVTINYGAEIDGDIDAGGDVTINYGAEIDGSVSADGTVTDYR